MAACAGVSRLSPAEGVESGAPSPSSSSICDLTGSEGKAAAQSLGPAAEFTATDVREPVQWKQAVDACRSHFDAAPDILVHTAGIMVGGAVDTCRPEDLERSLAVNTMGTLHGIQAVAPGMREGHKGSIVVVTSMAGVTFGCPGLAPYSASKAAMAALVRCAALDFANSGIRINSVVPGQVDTPMSRAFMSSVGPDFFAKMPIPRSGQPRDIAHAALYLASDESSWVTGTDLLVDGGMEAGPVLG
ncbi:SDR family NAD(P)-dependent oxidoreductase [Streptomyces odonnellii]|uniref:SDR family NAD(P)-dependent oxidoreductase n=1 Tax=Streptomyces odonnellii TaxID=1417980 RepID=UPI000D08A0AE|nr:SDR family oxidoreductase [Streptomyces odonnellii]